MGLGSIPTFTLRLSQYRQYQTSCCQRKSFFHVMRKQIGNGCLSRAQPVVGSHIDLRTTASAGVVEQDLCVIVGDRISDRLLSERLPSKLSTMNEVMSIYHRGFQWKSAELAFVSMLTGAISNLSRSSTRRSSVPPSISGNGNTLAIYLTRPAPPPPS